MRRHYNKLVRDLIPAIIQESGQSCATRMLSPDEYREALLAKLVEEAQEVAQAMPAQRVIELADVLEVLEALLVTEAISFESVRAVQAERRRNRGGFEQRVCLLWTEEILNT